MKMFREFSRKASDFLEPMSDQDLACTMGICQDPEVCVHGPKLFKCKTGDNVVKLDTFDDAGLLEARKQCAARSDLHTEPVGGAGNDYFVNTLPDKSLTAAHLHHEPVLHKLRAQIIKRVLCLLCFLVALEFGVLVFNDMLRL